MIECGHLIVQVFLQLLFKRAYRRRPGVRGGTRDGANHIGNPPLRHIDLVRDHLDGILKRLKGFICISRGNLSVHPDGGQRIPDLVCHPRDNARDMGLSLIHISEPTRLRRISYAVFCLKKKKKENTETRSKIKIIDNKKKKDK